MKKLKPSYDNENLLDELSKKIKDFVGSIPEFETTPFFITPNSSINEKTFGVVADNGHGNIMKRFSITIEDYKKSNRYYYMVSVSATLRQMGYKNVEVVGDMTFHWNGEHSTKDVMQPIKTLESNQLSDDFTLSDFLTKHKDDKIVLKIDDYGNIINKENKIFAFIG